MNIGSEIDSEDFDLRRKYRIAIDCLAMCESVIGTLQSQLAARDEEVAALEERAVRMSFELASLKAFEDAHRSRRRVPDEDGGAGAFDPSPNPKPRPPSPDETCPPSLDETCPPSPDETPVPAMDFGSLDYRLPRLSGGSTTVSWGGEDRPALDDCATPPTRASSFYVHPNGNDDCAMQERGYGNTSEEKFSEKRNGATRYDRFDYETIWRSCVSLQEEIRRSAFYLEHQATRWERDPNAWARMWRV